MLTFLFADLDVECSLVGNKRGDGNESYAKLKGKVLSVTFPVSILGRVISLKRGERSTFTIISLRLVNGLVVCHSTNHTEYRSCVLTNKYIYQG